MIIDQHPNLPDSPECPQCIEGIGGHQVGEVRRAECGRQPQMDGDSAIVDEHRPDEPEIGDGLVELGIGDRRECVEDLGFSGERRGGHIDTLSLAPAATSAPP